MKTRIISVLLILSMLFSLAACGGDSGKANTPDGETYATEFVDWEEQRREVTTFLMNYTEASATAKLLVQTVSPLLEHDAHGKLVPALAESWESNADATKWTFHLKKGLYWVNQKGEKKSEITAYDWLTALEWDLNYQKNEGYNSSMPNLLIKGCQEYYDTVKEMDVDAGKALKYTDPMFQSVGIKAPDKYTLEFEMAAPCPYFDTLATCTCLFPICQDLVDEIGVDGVFGQQPDTMWYCGPYRITSYVNNNSKILTRNEEYWDKESQLFDTVTILMVQDANADDTMFFNGEIDSCQLSDANLRMIVDDPNSEWKDYLVKIHTKPANQTLLWNYAKNNSDGTPDTNWNKAIANENFRQSIRYGMQLRDLWAYYDYIDPESCVCNTFSAPGVAQFSNGQDYADRIEEIMGRPGIRYDQKKADDFVSKAKAELTAQGVTFPVTMNFYVKAGDQAQLDRAEILETLIEGIAGKDYIDFVIGTYVSSSSKEVTNPSLHSFSLIGWIADYGDPSNFIDQIQKGNTSVGFGHRTMKLNDMEVSEASKQFDTYTKMTKDADAIVNNNDARYEAQAQAEAYLLDHALIIPLYVTIPWRITKINTYTAPFSSYGVTRHLYKNMNVTTKNAYTAEEYDQFLKDYEAAE